MRATLPLGGRRTLLAVLLSFILAGTGRSAPLLKDDDQRLRDQALKLNLVTGDDPILGQIVLLLEDKDNAKKLVQFALKMAKDADKEKEKEAPFNVNATWILARVAQRLKENEAAEHFYRQHATQALKLASSQKFVRGYTSLIDLLYLNKQFAEAEKACREFLEIRGDENIQTRKLLVLRRMVQTQAKQGKIDEAMRVVDNLIKVQPENWLTRELKGWVLREAGKYDEAAKTYEDVLDRITRDDRLDKDQKKDFGGDIRYTLSGVYIDLKKVEKAVEQLRTLVKQDEDNPTYNNDLGFILADNDMALDEAEKLVRKALEEDRKLRKKAGITGAEDHDNAAYLDSLGWVLFKRKKYKEALAPLLEAVKYEDGQHVEIYDHLGDVYLALGEIEKALEAWKKGLECQNVSKRDDERKSKVEDKLKKHAKR
jgi:tetratricopeptide (TPR) repeat protein